MYRFAAQVYIQYLEDSTFCVLGILGGRRFREGKRGWWGDKDARYLKDVFGSGYKGTHWNVTPLGK